ncbi:hypothetical protein ACEQ8H_004462 [Pleosporales sp. CAS-2024a]
MTAKRRGPFWDSDSDSGCDNDNLEAVRIGRGKSDKNSKEIDDCKEEEDGWDAILPTSHPKQLSLDKRAATLRPPNPAPKIDRDQIRQKILAKKRTKSKQQDTTVNTTKAQPKTKMHPTQSLTASKSNTLPRGSQLSRTQSMTDMVPEGPKSQSVLHGASGTWAKRLDRLDDQATSSTTKPVSQVSQTVQDTQAYTRVSTSGAAPTSMSASSRMKPRGQLGVKNDGSGPMLSQNGTYVTENAGSIGRRIGNIPQGGPSHVKGARISTINGTIASTSPEQPRKSSHSTTELPIPPKDVIQSPFALKECNVRIRNGKGEATQRVQDLELLQTVSGTLEGGKEPQSNTVTVQSHVGSPISLAQVPNRATSELQATASAWKRKAESDQSDRVHGLPPFKRPNKRHTPETSAPILNSASREEPSTKAPTKTSSAMTTPSTPTVWTEPHHVTALISTKGHFMQTSISRDAIYKCHETSDTTVNKNHEPTKPEKYSTPLPRNKKSDETQLAASKSQKQVAKPKTDTAISASVSVMIPAKTMTAITKIPENIASTNDDKQDRTSKPMKNWRSVDSSSDNETNATPAPGKIIGNKGQQQVACGVAPLYLPNQPSTNKSKETVKSGLPHAVFTPTATSSSSRHHILEQAKLPTSILPTPPTTPTDVEPFFEYSVFSKFWSDPTPEASVDPTELTLLPSTNIDHANAHVQKLFHSAREQYENHFRLHFIEWTSKPDQHGCHVFAGKFRPIECPNKISWIKYWVQRDEVSAYAGRTLKQIKGTSFVARTVYVLRLFKLLPSPIESDAEAESDDSTDTAMTRIYHPIPWTECYTTLEAANHAAKNLQIEMSHNPNPDKLDQFYQTQDLAKLNSKLSALQQSNVEESKYWRSKFNGRGLGSTKFELVVEKVGLCGPRNL